MKSSVLRKILVVSLAFVLIATLTIPQFIQADNVTIVEEKNPELQLEKINDPNAECHAGYPDLQASFQQNNNQYKLTGNGWNQWDDSDHLPFAYKKVIFNYGKKVATLVVEAQLNSWDGTAPTGGAGVMIRSSLDPSAATVFMHIRPSSICVTYRPQDGTDCGYNELKVPPLFPIKLRIELNGTKAICSYKLPADERYTQLSSATYYSTKPSLYVGIASQSVIGDALPTADFTDFSYKVLAPEGTPPSTDETTSNGGSDDDSDTPVIPDEPEVVLPEDPPVGPDVLLSETFTDDSMTAGEASVTNPIWTTNSIAPPDIITNDAQTNRYLYEWMTNAYYYAGDESWTDYQTELDLTFTRDYNSSEKNAFDIYTRVTSIPAYGYHAYVLRFSKASSGGKVVNKITLGSMDGKRTLSPDTSITEIASIEYDYSQKVAIPLHITIRTIDNKIKVFIREGDGEEKMIFDVADNSYNIKITGAIGFSAADAGYEIDNIKVTRLNDPLGGDYDNRIAGLWDEETPEYIQYYIDKGYQY